MHRRAVSRIVLAVALTLCPRTQDWAEMLSRMYERWATAQGFSAKARAPARASRSCKVDFS